MTFDNMEATSNTVPNMKSKRYLETCLYVFLSLIFSFSVTYSIQRTNSFVLFILLLSLYYLSEYLITLRYNHASISSFLLSYETGHLQFIVFSIFEHFVLNHLTHIILKDQNYNRLFDSSNFAYILDVYNFYNSYRTHSLIQTFFILSTFFLILRIFSRLSLKEDFTHKIRTAKNNTHILKTTGVYGYLRHPGYTSWYYWNVCMQLILGNVFCLFAAIYVPLSFFKERIEFEEDLLEEFFGERYREYKKKTYILIPYK
eukprot:GAHX01001599.1.p1 GENE.GAHX01001599.1~~GAHX01001599.1.p1  ORF type:complete len:258 (-),score=32.52 GAHX01001599.1:32-805(-)